MTPLDTILKFMDLFNSRRMAGEGREWAGQEWWVYADNKPVYDIVAKMRRPWPGQLDSKLPRLLQPEIVP